MSKELIAFCKDAGIKRVLMVPCNPQCNGIAKREKQNSNGSCQSHAS